MQEFKHQMDRKLGWELEVTVLCQGGTGLEYVRQNINMATGFDMLVVMTGGNDVANGKDETFLEYQYGEIAMRAHYIGVQEVVFTSIWPRKDRGFNDYIKELNSSKLKKYAVEYGAIFWLWDKRQPFFTEDGVHLSRRGYQRAVEYLTSAILWTKNNRF